MLWDYHHHPPWRSNFSVAGNKGFQVTTHTFIHSILKAIYVIVMLLLFKLNGVMVKICSPFVMKVEKLQINVT
jgi:hypothetical protein